MIKNILLDRDGTLIEEKGYLSDPEEVVFVKGAYKFLKEAFYLGMNLFVITNQSGIGRGYFSLKDYLKVRNWIHKELKNKGIFIKDEVFCPHAPYQKCKCRKPDIGMWETLRKKHGLKPDETVIIGDKLSDIEFGENAGLRFKILVLTGHGKEELKRLAFLSKAIRVDFGLASFFEVSQNIKPRPDVVVKDLPSAILWLKRKADL